ncbi:pyridoxal kinase PdxY [Granulibacter bethesdensis]|uniref:pyridoxal kinase PdxY n=1 Tax=Granulibacter bethesdensis TaxID=364410 RepID=UPI000932CAC2|nr:pyridoxal kinase PdxY [Granulibacter bethesdensis]
MNILSIQSWVCYGHVGNASAVFPLQLLGAEVWAVNTVQFSNHTGYGDWTGQVFGGGDIAALMKGIADRGVLPRCDAVLSGYMGSDAIGGAILDAVASVRAANPEALYCCDPVIGDTGRGIFVRPGLPELFRDRAVPTANILTPNQFELEWLTGHHCRTLADARAAVMALAESMIRQGPRIILVTSLHVAETPSGSLDMLVYENGRFYLLRTPLLPVNINGAGDAIAALFLFHRLDTGDARQALEKAASSVYGLLKQTAEAGSMEILTVAARQEFLTPSTCFSAQLC